MTISLGDRMKKYESCFRLALPSRMPVILRLDGQAFHTLTKKCKKPFDEDLIDALNFTAMHLCETIQNAQIAYLQSDEISILIHNYKRLNSCAWFDNDIQKICSSSAAHASAKFSSLYRFATFDAKVFILPENEVNNYFVWRQQDWERNSIQMLARSVYSHKELISKKIPDMHEMLYKKGLNWSKLETHLKRGRCIEKGTLTDWVFDNDIPVFKNDHFYINKFLKVDEE